MNTREKVQREGGAALCTLAQATLFLDLTLRFSPTTKYRAWTNHLTFLLAYHTLVKVETVHIPITVDW